MKPSFVWHGCAISLMRVKQQTRKKVKKSEEKEMKEKGREK